MQIIPTTKSVVQTIYSYVNGDAVFKARGLYAMLVPGLDYDDMEICNSIGVYKGGKSLYEFENELLTGKSNKPTQGDLILYPNPSNGFLILEFPDNRALKGEFVLLDLIGNTLHRINISSISNIATLNFNKPCAGVYIYKFESIDNTHYTGKLIIE